MKPILIAAAAALLALPASAATQLEQGVARELPLHGFDVDVSTLSEGQLAALHAIMNSNALSHSAKISRIRSVLGGPYSLRGLLKGS